VIYLFYLKFNQWIYFLPSFQAWSLQRFQLQSEDSATPLPPPETSVWHSTWALSWQSFHFHTLLEDKVHPSWDTLLRGCSSWALDRPSTVCLTSSANPPKMAMPKLAVASALLVRWKTKLKLLKGKLPTICSWLRATFYTAQVLKLMIKETNYENNNFLNYKLSIFYILL